MRGLIVKRARRLAFLLAGCVLIGRAAPGRDLTLVTLDPGHFHAALFQREMLPGIAEEEFVYAPLGPDLTAHLNRVAQFNLRKDQRTTDAKHVIACDAMTDHFEISSVLQRQLVNDRGIFGDSLKGSVEEPAVYMESLHCLLKAVGGVPNLRPVWFFDIRQQGEGLADVGTHLVERAQWALFPDQVIDYKRDIEVLMGTRWPTTLTRPQFQRASGASEFPDFLRDAVKNDPLEYFCNNTLNYTSRGIHVKLDVRWAFEAQPGDKDTHRAVFRGNTSNIELHQGKDQQFRPELFVVPRSAGAKATVRAALKKRLEALQESHPGVALEEQPDRFHVIIPDILRTGHEAHFALVAQRFLDYVKNPQALPAWEKSNMLAKYYVTTKGVQVARRNLAKP